MIGRIIKKENIPKFLDELMKDYDVIAPVRVGGDFFFRIIKSRGDVCMDFSNTALPPKEFFLPHSEQIFEFEKENILSGNETLKKRIIFGIRPCDVNALSLLDKVYFDDPYYMKRRKNTILISIACNDPPPDCFCLSLGTGPHSSDADITLTDLGDRYYAEVKNDRIINPDLFENPIPEDKEKRDKKHKEAENKIIKQIDPEDISNRMGTAFDSQYWDKVAARCLSCGACTYLCPTCYCFDISDKSMFSAYKGKRIRCWDSCMFPGFTELAGGENPRATKVERFKQRAYHKFKYFLERYGQAACVGCGRCINSCPVGIDISSVINERE